MLTKLQIKKNGFSLIELLVVISIISVLSAVLVSNFMGMRERARDAQKIEDLYAIKNALRLYYNDKQTYPGGVDNSPYDLTTEMSSVYMPSISGIGYTYVRTNNGDGFNLCVGLEAGAADDDVNSQVKCGAFNSGVCNLGVGVTMDKFFVVCGN